MLVRTSTALLQADFSLYGLTKWVTPAIKEECTESSYGLTEEEQKRQKEQQEPPEFGKASETKSHILVKQHTADKSAVNSTRQGTL